MADGSFDVKGLKQLSKQLKTLPDKIADRVLLNALRGHGKLVVDNAKSMVPVDTGQLRSSIAQRAAKKKYKKYRREVHVGVLRDSTLRGKAFRKSPGFYWRMVEFGTKSSCFLPVTGTVLQDVKSNKTTIIRLKSFLIFRMMCSPFY